jgi:hypothetical protein
MIVSKGEEIGSGDDGQPKMASKHHSARKRKFGIQLASQYQN